MRIPYVIDNQSHNLADVLTYLLETQPVQAADICTAYFSIRGYQQIKEGLESLGSFRLLLGAEPTAGEHIGMRPSPQRVIHQLRRDLNMEPFDEDTLRLVEELIAFLTHESVEVRFYLGHDPADEARHRAFLHAKCYLLYGGRGGQRAMFDRLNPLVGIVGSSNFTGPGLTSNRELNTVHKTILDANEVDDLETRAEVDHHAEASVHTRITEDNRRLIKSEVGARAIIDLAQWYQDQWELAIDFEQDLIDLLNESKFGQYEYTPYQVYMKALYEYFREGLGADVSDVTRTAVELTEFQEDAVRKARRILAQYDGVMIADSVGLGKTWIGKRLLEDYAYHLRQKALVICPASLRAMWQGELRSATIAAEVISQEEMGRPEFDIGSCTDVDVVLIDESHNFRNHRTQRYQNLELMLSANGRRGRNGSRKKLILLTATPINNNVFDLYSQINLFTGGDRSYLAGAGIGDVYRYFLAARRAATDYEATVELFNLLEEVVVRRTRPFIREAYPDATIAGKKVRWPERRLRTINYDLEQAYQGIYQDIVTWIESLRLAHYGLEEYKLDKAKRDEFELGRQMALVGIFKTRFLKRLESSIEAFRISIRRALEFVKTFDAYLSEGRLLDSSSFREAMRYLDSEGEDDAALPTSRADGLEAIEEARAVLDELPTLDITEYDLRALRTALTHDIDAFTEIWYRVRDIRPEQDAKLQKLKEMLGGELRGCRVLVFTYYRDTARYLGRQLIDEASVAFRASAGDPNMRRIDGGTSPADRVRVIQAFAPKANNREDIAGTADEIDVLISTDVLSEGQNLQDAGIMLNYDLPWNPTRMVQRAGRIDRLGSEHDLLWIYNMFPDEGLEQLLGIVQRLSLKIETIDQTGFLDASILGETVHPRNFNTLRRIREEDDTVIEEQESFAELASSEALLRQLQQQLTSGQAREWLESLPDGIHSGLYREATRGVFFYFAAPARDGGGRQHFWRYYDLQTGQVLDNRLLIANLIQCQPDTPRFTGEGQVDIFEVQERIIQDIVKSSQERRAMEAAPKRIDPVQQTLITTLRGYLNNPDLSRRELQQLMRFLGNPLPGVYVGTLRGAYQVFVAARDIHTLVEAMREVQAGVGAVEQLPVISSQAIDREKLHLICFDYVWS